MVKWKRLVVPGLCLALWGTGASPLAQDAPAPEPAPEEEPQAPPPPTPPEPPKKESKKLPWGLYVGVAAGAASTKDIDTSVQTLTTEVTSNTLRLPEQDFARAAVGWRLPEGKGDFRLVFNGYKEAKYEFDSIGAESLLALGSAQTLVSGPVDWWTLSIRDGLLTSQRTPRVWLVTDDANMNGAADPEEVRQLAPDVTIARQFTDNLQNQVQTVDLLYGREFGGRRFSSHWWGGLRAFEYRGNILAGAWLDVNVAGVGFTDGAFFRPLIFSQDSSGFGPTGAWEVDFNFFNKGLVMFVRAQTALSFNSNKLDSGEFFTSARPTPSLGFIVMVPARLQVTRDKTAWQNTAEAGVRIVMRNGLQFELGYSKTGYLDIVTSPIDIDIPETLGQIEQGTSALYATQDYVVEGWHAGLAFQF